MTILTQDDLTTKDAFNRVLATPEIAINSTLPIIFDPVRNPDEGGVVAIGIRTRSAY